MVEGVEREPRVGAQRQIEVLQFPLFGRENLCGLDRGAAGGDGPGVPMPRRDIPAPRPAVVAVRRRAEPQVRPTGPIRRVVAGAEPPPTPRGDLLEPIAPTRQPRARQAKLCSAPAVFWRDAAPAPQPPGAS